MENDLPMKNKWVISDTHFWHKRIIDYCARPFVSVEQMNDELVRRWNCKIKTKDTVYHLGDFSMGDKDMVSAMVSRLNGYKILVLGNHDRKSISWWERVGFDEVYKSPLTVDDYIFSHYPLPQSQTMFSRKVNVHGHLHSRFIRTDNKHVCVCVDYTDFFPISFSSLPKLHKKQAA